MMRVSAWGHRSCAEGGDCASVNYEGCDDKSPCTLDVCNAKTGKCEHSKIDGLLCDPQDGCTIEGVCTQGKCVADPNGLLWSRLHAWEWTGPGAASHYQHAGVGAILGTRDGGALVLGHRHKNQYPKFHHSGSYGSVRRLDHTGALLWKYDLPYSRDPHGFDGNRKFLMERHNGELWLGYQQQTSANGYGRSSHIVRWDKTGKKLSSFNWKEKAGGTEKGVTAIAEQPDGSTGYVIHTSFLRRNAQHTKVSTKLLRQARSIAHLVGASNGRWIAVGKVGVKGYVTLLAPDGAAQWATTPGGLSGTWLYKARDDGSKYIYAAGISAAPVPKRRLLVARLASKTGALKGVIEAAKLEPGAAVLTSLGPADGFAFIGKWGAGTGAKVRLLTTSATGRLRFARDLEAGTLATVFAIAPGTDDGLVYGGFRIDKDGKRKTAISKTGPWGNTPCPAAGLCKGVGADDCGDSNPCTLDVCEPDAGCTHTKLSCDDGSACTIDSCDAGSKDKPGKGCKNAAIDCSDGRTCTDDVCHSVGGGGVKAGCTNPLKPLCNDGSACTTDSCSAQSKCVHTKVDCDDKNACTTDWCEPASGCKHKKVICNDLEPCTLDTCNWTSGCSFSKLSDGAVCEDKDACVVLPEGTCKNSKCQVGGKDTKGCSSKTPAKTCVEARAAAGGTLNNLVGWVWLDKDGTGPGVAKRAWCDMKVGGYERLYADGVTRSTATWIDGKKGTCTGGAASKDLWVPAAISKKHGKGTGNVTTHAALDVPQAHTKVRVRFSYHLNSGNPTYKSWAQVEIRVAGKRVHQGSTGALPVVWGGDRAKHAGKCTGGFGGSTYKLRGDYKVDHTDKSVALSVRSYTSASTISYGWALGDVEVWVK